MAAQSEREPGVVGMCSCSLVDEPMAQDEIPEQDIVVEEQELPQTDSEPGMGAAAAAKYDTSPPLLHQNPPPNPAETAQPSTLEIILQALGGLRNEMEANTRRQDEIKKQHGKENGWHDANAAGRDAVHECRPTGGTRATKGGNGKEYEDGRAI